MKLPGNGNRMSWFVGVVVMILLVVMGWISLSEKQDAAAIQMKLDAHITETEPATHTASRLSAVESNYISLKDEIKQDHLETIDRFNRIESQLQRGSR